MEYVIRGLTFALIPIIVSGVLAFLRRPKKAEKGKVCLPIALTIVGVICSAFFLIPTLICAFSDEPIWVSIVFLLFSMLSASLIVAYINCRISYDEDGFTAKNFFGIKRRFTYDQITGIKENIHETYLYMGKRRIMIDEFGIGGMEFIWFANQKYRKLHHNRLIPKIQNTKDIFNGNIASAGEMLFAFILIGVLGIGIFIFIICVVFLPSTKNNTVERQTVFQSYTKKDRDWIMESTDGQMYKIKFTDSEFDADLVPSLCDEKTVYTTYSKKMEPDHGENYYDIKAIMADGNYVLTFEETARMNAREYWPLIPFVGLIITLPACLFIIFGIKVGRNPTRYSPKTVKFFFKPEYVKNYSEVVRQYNLKKRK